MSTSFSQLHLIWVWIPDSCLHPCSSPPAVPLHPRFPSHSTFTNNCFQTVTGSQEILLNQSLHSAVEAGTQQVFPKKPILEKPQECSNTQSLGELYKNPSWQMSLILCSWSWIHHGIVKHLENHLWEFIFLIGN